MTMHHQISEGVRQSPLLYHSGSETCCPGCGESQWYVGRFSAECAVCALALPLAPRGVIAPALLKPIAA